MEEGKIDHGNNNQERFEEFKSHFSLGFDENGFPRLSGGLSIISRSLNWPLKATIIIVGICCVTYVFRDYLKMG